MARMIPLTPHISTSSIGEKEIFSKLQSDPHTQEWIVLHSLDIANHRRHISGEVDFVVIVPGKGVLCVEVKACHRIRRTGGQWYYGADPKPDSRGPFKQASEAMHSLRKRLSERSPSLSRIPFWSAVIFPYIPFEMQSEEWHSWQVIDSRHFTSYPIGRLLEGILDRARTNIVSKQSAFWFQPTLAEPTPSQCSSLAKILRPDFEFFESPKSRAHRQNEEIKHYTEEQFIALDTMEANPRVLFRGPAGTGKTMLAIEIARRSCQIGRKTLFLCYNRLLGKWLEEQTTGLQSNITCKTIHSYMLSVINVSPWSQTPNFWQDELPLKATKALLENANDRHMFDELIIDEAQDILRENYMDVLDLSIKGGLSSGHWHLFGDFEKQTIYQAANLSLEQFRQTYAPQVPIYSLRINCRNKPRVAELVHLLGGLRPHYTRILRPDDKIEPEIHYYNDDFTQQVLLINTLQRLYSDGFLENEITILSPHVGSACTASKIQKSPWKEKLKPIERASWDHISYCSISTFKGMESSVIVVTDINKIDDNTSNSLFYIAVTRALHRLVILMHEHTKKDIKKLLSLSDEK
jgi:Nuclease-related domain/AAA domain